MGIVVFKNLHTAISAGFQVCECRPDGYLVRTRTPNGWAFALALLGPNAGSQRVSNP